MGEWSEKAQSKPSLKPGKALEIFLNSVSNLRGLHRIRGHNDHKRAQLFTKKLIYIVIISSFIGVSQTPYLQESFFITTYSHPTLGDPTHSVVCIF